jgi:hypothetical protein
VLVDVGAQPSPSRGAVLCLRRRAAQVAPSALFLPPASGRLFVQDPRCLGTARQAHMKQRNSGQHAHASQQSHHPRPSTPASRPRSWETRRAAASESVQTHLGVARAVTSRALEQTPHPSHVKGTTCGYKVSFFINLRYKEACFCPASDSPRRGVLLPRHSPEE